MFFKRVYLFIFRERGREGEKHQYVRGTWTSASRTSPAPSRDQMTPNQGWNGKILKKILFIDFFRERRREGEKHWCVRETSVASCVPPMECTAPVRHRAHNPGMYSDRESNQGPFGSQTGAQLTEPQQPGLVNVLMTRFLKLFTWWIPIFV